MDDGALEYSGSGPSGVFGQPRNLIRPRFWSMLADLVRFYRQASFDANLLDDQQISLGDYLRKGQYGEAFRDDHLLPLASAIWSATPAEMLSYPAAAFIRFHDNHGLLQLSQRPAWETVVGGSRNYVERLAQSFAERIRLDADVREVRRMKKGVVVTDSKGHAEQDDHVVMASHADQVLKMLTDPSNAERDLLGAFRYSRNLAALHTDESFMPKRRAVWSSWNYIGCRNAARDDVCVTYWMNRLQNIESKQSLFVTLESAAPAACWNVAPQRSLRTSDLRRQGDRRSATSCGCCKVSTTRGFAARISARAFTRTGCRRTRGRRAAW